MISESKLRELLHDNVPESSILDFKRDLYRLEKNPDKKTEDHFKSEFIKDILSMANTPREETSYIVIGVQVNPDGTKTLVGVPGNHPDDANLHPILNLAQVQPKPEFSYQAIRLDGLSYGVIEIPLQNHGPYIPTKNFGVLASSHVYFRNSSMNDDASPQKQNEIYEWFIGRRAAAKQASSYQPPTPLALTVAQQKRNRTVMLNRVRSYWIKGVLDHSLSGIPLTLGLQEESAMVTGSLYRDMSDAGHYRRKLSADTPISQVYADANGELLILGEAGSGKTTLLLELARDLLESATNDELHPIPAVFNLSLWAVKRQPLSQWLIEELERKYMVPHKLAVSWVTNDQLLPLLDGLDEVATAHRESCIEAINTYHREHGLVPLIVACRWADYDTLQTRLQLHTTVQIQPLTARQIDDYLTSAGEQANALRFILHQDPALQELATTPLLLNILMQAYQDKQIEDLISTEAPATQRQRVLANYVQRMLQQKGQQMRYQSSQVVHWLSWLACQLAHRGLTEFSIERIQPDWLVEPQGRHAYGRLGVRLPGALFGIAISPIIWIASSSLNDTGNADSLYYIILIMLIGGLIGGLFSETPRERRLERSLIPTIVVGGFITLIAALLYKLTNVLPSSWNQALSGAGILGFGSFLLSLLVLNGFVGRVNTEIGQVSVTSRPLETLWFLLLKRGHLRNGAVVGLIYGLAFWLDSILSPRQYFPAFGGLVYGLILGISGIILSAILGGREKTVQPVEVLAWSWSDFWHAFTSRKHLLKGLLIGVVCGLICGLTASVRAGSGTTMLSEGWAYAVGDGLAVGLGSWLFATFLQGISGATLDERLRTVPNQGIRHSKQNGLLMSILGTCLGGVFAFLAVLLRNMVSEQQFAIIPPYAREALISALIVGLASGIIVGLLNGWLAWIRHVVLRVLLSRAGAIPSDYPNFLDEAAARVLLRKVGGSYIFIHQLLLDYFAKQDIELPKDPLLVNS